ncbi:DNA-3-methyladenine glycosylase family protein [Lachnobacterium bovis]|uniref:DNA-(apurinic or apyrimidinic site) lyase n=1 Tax=Lachnobacterium bovis TaxID=140626 RepID=A0A1H9P8I5_9FIRM|nr:DNA glycosylase [Lachnobacterium bovis]SER44205.1 N-glycosylase/DNA lyase [Lachnobacterium bovis]
MQELFQNEIDVKKQNIFQSEVEIIGDFDLKKIENSGEVFRFNEVGNGIFCTIAFGRVLYIRKKFNQTDHAIYEISCSKQEFMDIWYDYFDLSTDYEKIRNMISKEDKFLYNAAEYSKGVRILIQDPWEMIVSFVISQRKNIPAIKKAVETLCECAGNLIDKDKKIYSFPTPEQMYNMSEEDWNKCALGYRTKYLKTIVEQFYYKEITIASLQELDDDKLYNKLLDLYGVGPKVASCIMLFGFHRLNSFPKDVWILRILEEQYNNNFDLDKYSPYNGVIQQYMFYGSLELGRKV